MATRILLVVAVLVAFNLLPLRVAMAQTTPPELFEPVPTGFMPPPEGRPRLHPAQHVLQYVKLNLDLVSPQIAGQVDAGHPQRLSLNLSDHERYVAALDKASFHSPNRYILRGDVENVSDGRVIAAFRAGVMAAEVNLGQRLLQIRQQSGDIYAVIEVNQAAFPPESPPVPADAAVPDDTAPRIAPSLSCPDLIEVLVLYTDDARQAAGGVANIEAEIDLAVERTNEAYENSGVIQRLALGGPVEVAFNEGNDFGVMLEQLINPSDGVVDHIHRLRAREVGADIVSMIVDTNIDIGSPGGTTCGRGSLMRDLSPSFRDRAFNLVVRGCSVSNLTFAHELGHNMGLQHNREDADSTPVFPYAYGYRRSDPANPATNFRTIMAVPPCSTCPPIPRIPNFSNPDVFHNGVPTGVAESDSASCQASCDDAFQACRACAGGPPCPGVLLCAQQHDECFQTCNNLPDRTANAARALNDTRCVVAQFSCQAFCDAAFEDCRACVGGPPCPSVITCAMRREECFGICQ